MRVVKKGCTANGSEMGIFEVPGSIRTQTRMCSELHIQCPWKTHTCVGHASDIVRLLYAGCFVLSLCLHTECPYRCFCQEASILPLFRIK